MTIRVWSEKKNRWYERKFDYDEARRLRSEGVPLSEVARRLGVSNAAVERVCNPERMRRMNEQSKRFIRKHRRKPCKGGCGKLVWLVNEGRSGFCINCLTTQVVMADEVRETELHCRGCGLWKPDEEFPLAKNRMIRGEWQRTGVSRRHRASRCRMCATAQRREHRHRFPEVVREYDRRREQDRREQRRQTMEYVVLRKKEDGVYLDVGHYDATSADAAIEAVAGELNEEGEYVAVSLGRFEVVQVAPKTSLRVSRAK